MKERGYKSPLVPGLVAGVLVVAAWSAVSSVPAAACDVAAVETGSACSGAMTSLTREPAGSSPTATPAATPGESAPAASAPTTTGTPPVAASGLLIHIDPQTGAVLKEAAPGSVPLQLGPDLTNALDTSHRGLVEEQGAMAGHGVKVHLQGRFQSPIFATTDASGKLTLQHLREPAPSAGDR